MTFRDRQKADWVARIAGSLIAYGAVLGAASAQSVVANGSTATSVSTGGNGRVTVGIAPVGAAGVSVNRYSAFSVTNAGVDLNNRIVGANTIVNEVAGASRTNLNGPLEVLGTRAHVVIVNPNGVSVDGGQFIHTGGVALSGGTIRYSGNNPVLNTGTGDVTITGQGLTGQMTSLQLIAAKLKIDGPVRVTHPSPNAELALVASNHDVALDSSLTAGSTLRPWASRADLGGSSNEILVDVTSRGTLEASRVHVAVSARGAGVAFAGRGQASVGEFTINANGQVTMSGGGSIRAEKAVKVVATGIDVLNAPVGQGSIESLSGGVTLLANAGNINISGSVTGYTRDTTDADSRGAVTLKASGNISLVTESADRLALAFAASDDLSVTAGGALTNNTGRLLSNARTRIVAGSVSNQIDVINATALGAPRITATKGRRFWQSLWRSRKKYFSLRQDFGQLRVAGQLAYIVGQNVEIDTGTFVNSGEIDAQNGALILQASSILNQGARAGTLVYEKSCGLICRSSGKSLVSSAGGAINAAQGMMLTSLGPLINAGGQITAYGNMAIRGGDIRGITQFSPSVVARPSGLNALFAGPYAWVSQQQVGGLFLTPTGEISVSSPLPVTLEGGDLLAGGGVINPGGVLRLFPAGSTSGTGQQSIGLLRGWF